MNRTIYIFFLILLILLCQACKSAAEAPPKSHIPEFRHDGSLEIRSARGELKASFEIEIAQKEMELMRGLKYREQMEESQAMLFVFEHIDFHSFWMQDTYLSLDMIFIDHEGVVVSIAKNTPPFSEEPIFPDKANKYVLEVLAGITDKFNIIETDIVTWKRN